MGSGCSGARPRLPQQILQKTAGDSSKVVGVASCSGALDRRQGVEQDDDARRQQFEASMAPIEVFGLAADLQLDIIREPETLWLAEQLYHVDLPLGWCRSRDAQGRLFYHNDSSDASQWTHPLEHLFKEVALYQREAMREGHFCNVDEQVRKISEAQMAKAHEWKQVFNERGHAFWLHGKSNEVSAIDPREAAQSDIKLRHVLIDKMKARLPALALALPEANKQQAALPEKLCLKEAEYRGPQNSFILDRFAILAKRYLRLVRWQNQIMGPLGHRVEKVPSREYVKLDFCTPSRKRELAATRIQRVYRGMLARRRIDSVKQHHLRRCECAMKIQCCTRKLLRERHDIQKMLRREESAREESARLIHACVQMHLARHVVVEQFKVHSGENSQALGRILQRCAQEDLILTEQGTSKDILSRQAKILLSRESLTKCVLVELPRQEETILRAGTDKVALESDAWNDNLRAHGRAIVEALLKPFARQKVGVLVILASNVRLDAAAEDRPICVDKRNAVVERRDNAVKVQVVVPTTTSAQPFQHVAQHNLQSYIKDMQTETTICSGKNDSLGQSFQGSSASSQSHPWQQHPKSMEPIKPKMQSSLVVMGKEAIPEQIHHDSPSKAMRVESKGVTSEAQQSLCMSDSPATRQITSSPKNTNSAAAKLTSGTKKSVAASEQKRLPSKTSQAASALASVAGPPRKLDEDTGRRTPSAYKQEASSKAGLPAAPEPPIHAKVHGQTVSRSASKMEYSAPQDISTCKLEEALAEEMAGPSIESQAEDVFSEPKSLVSRQASLEECKQQSDKLTDGEFTFDRMATGSTQGQLYQSPKDAITSTSTDETLADTVFRQKFLDASLPEAELVGSIGEPIRAQMTQTHVEHQVQKMSSTTKKKKCNPAPISQASNFFDSMKDKMLIQTSIAHAVEPRRTRSTKAARFYEAVKDSRRHRKHAHALHNLQAHELRAGKFFSHQQCATATDNALFSDNVPHAMMPVTWQHPHPAPLSSYRHSSSSLKSRSLTSLEVDRSSFPTLLDETIDVALCS